MRLHKRVEDLEKSIAPRQNPIILFALTEDRLREEIRKRQAIEGPDVPIQGICWLPTSSPDGESYPG
ncbi:hypothetical protein [Bradyrhizobium sp. USDA 4452]